MNAQLYEAQFQNSTLLNTINLIAIEVLGHVDIRTCDDHSTYWDTAIMNLQVLDALDIKGKVFALGTSQGGWMSSAWLSRPDSIAGIMPLGTSLDYASERTRALGNFDCVATLTGPIQDLDSRDPTPEFVISEKFRGFTIYTGFGDDVDEETIKFCIGMNSLGGCRR